jgi:cellulose synthase/poly-beta-1,6-N-acetylglucosamine synthase-like glycosyltransferase
MLLNFGENINHGNMLVRSLENIHGSKFHFGILIVNMFSLILLLFMLLASLIYMFLMLNMLLLLV